MITRISILLTIFILIVQLKAICQVPDKYSILADSFLINRIGKNYFKSLQLVNNKKNGFEKYNNVDYKFDYILPIDSIIRYEFKIRINSDGTLYFPDYLPIPDCQNEPSLCTNLLSQEEALGLAKEIEFDKGIRDWQVAFAYDENDERFQWQIFNYEYFLDMGPYCERSNGEVLIIDCKTSKYRVDEWLKDCVH